MNSLFRRKAISTELPQHQQLARTLGWPHLLALGIGAIVGTGILTLIGVGAGRAGPAVLISFAVAGAICACAALAYAEMATTIPASGSAYTYSYTVLGEVFAWIVGWSLILEYSLVVATVAVGWSGYMTGFLKDIGLPLPDMLTHGPTLAGQACTGVVKAASFGINLPAVLIIIVVAALLSAGTRESARVNTALVVIKIATLALFVAVALPHFNSANLHPFAPYGYGAGNLHCDANSGSFIKSGMMASAAIIFFAFYGFDAISTAAEEAKNPKRDLAIGIVGSMAASTVIYILIAVTAVGAAGYARFADSSEPLALILRELQQGKVATIVAAGAIVALPTVILGFLYGQSRIFLVMARDGFLPPALAEVSRRGTPARITWVTAILVSVLAALVPLDIIASLANAGTLCAFIAVAACVLILRRREPGRDRGFRVPFAWVVCPAAILGCLYLFTSLQPITQKSFFVWNGVGLLIYFLYARRKAVLA